MTDCYRRAFEIEIPNTQAHQFQPPQPRCIQHFENRVVAQPKRRMYVRLLNDLLRLMRS